MENEIDAELKRAQGKRVEVTAFSLSYAGIMKKVDLERGTVEIVDGEDRAVLDIERITSFRVLR